MTEPTKKPTVHPVGDSDRYVVTLPTNSTPTAAVGASLTKEQVEDLALAAAEAVGIDFDYCHHCGPAMP